MSDQRQIPVEIPLSRDQLLGNLLTELRDLKQELAEHYPDKAEVQERIQEAHKPERRTRWLLAAIIALLVFGLIIVVVTNVGRISDLEDRVEHLENEAEADVGSDQGSDPTTSTTSAPGEDGESESPPIIVPGSGGPGGQGGEGGQGGQGGDSPPVIPPVTGPPSDGGEDDPPDDPGIISPVCQRVPELC